MVVSLLWPFNPFVNLPIRPVGSTTEGEYSAELRLDENIHCNSRSSAGGGFCCKGDQPANPDLAACRAGFEQR